MIELKNLQIWKSTKSDRIIERTIVDIFVNRNDVRVVKYRNYNGVTDYEEHEEKFIKWIALHSAKLKEYVPPVKEPEQILIKKEPVKSFADLAEQIQNPPENKPKSIDIEKPQSEIESKEILPDDLSKKLDKVLEVLTTPKPEPKKAPFYFPLLRGSDRTSIYIDGPNFYFTAKTLGFMFDYRRLYEHISRRTNLIRCHYYSVLVEDSDGYTHVKPLIDWLQYNNYSVYARTAKADRYNPKFDVDVDMIVDILNHAYKSKLDHMILFTGDSDYVRTVQSVQELGIKVTIVSTMTGGQVADSLRKIADSFVDLRDILHAFVLADNN